MTIPTEAIETAATYLPHSMNCEWQPEGDCSCWNPRKATMRAALEAAAPFMEPSEDAVREAMADGWDEAEQAKYVISLNPTGTAWEAIKTNPYRRKP